MFPVRSMGNKDTEKPAKPEPERPEIDPDEVLRRMLKTKPAPKLRSVAKD